MKSRIVRLLAPVLAVAVLAGGGFVLTAEETSAPRLTPEERALRAHMLEALAEGEAPEDALLFQRQIDAGGLTVDALKQTAAEVRAIEELTNRVAPRAMRSRWRLAGPSNVGGRISDLAVDQRRKGTVYVATASGGVWKTTDAGNTFRPSWRKRFPQGIGAMAIGSDNTLWVGTGEANPGGGSITYGGNGVYRSRDGGRTWRRVGLGRSSRIGRIAVNPKNPKHVLVAVTGNLFKPGGMRGLYATRDAGRTWKRVIDPPNPTTGIADVAFDPKNPKNVLAASWDHIRYPDYRDYTGPGAGLFRSTDGGKTFERLGPDSGFPVGSEDTGRVGVAFAPSDPSKAYAIIANNKVGAFHSFWVSVDGGQHWVAPPTAQTTLAESQLVYGWWFGRIFVDPKDANHVFVTGLPMKRSTDGGMSFPRVVGGGIHVDQHAMVWDPHVKDRAFIGNDGGFYVSTDNGASAVHRGNQPWVQFHSIDVSQQDPDWINGGLQDQGSRRSWGNNGQRYRGNKWDPEPYWPGDGLKNLINYKNKKNVFACYQYGECARSDDGGDSMEGMTFNSTRFNWLTPIEFDRKTPRIMYAGGNRLERSDDNGRSWTPISPDLAGNDPGREVNPLYANHYGTITAIGLSKASRKTIYVGTDNAYVWKTTNLGETWKRIETGLPNRWVSRIEVSNRNPRVAFITFSGFRQGDMTPYVFRTRNGGKRWVNITKNLPKAPVSDIIRIGRRIVVGTDVGVYATKPRRIRWVKIGRGFPRVAIHDIRYISKNDTLYAGTFGWGVLKVRWPF